MTKFSEIHKCSPGSIITPDIDGFLGELNFMVTTSNGKKEWYTNYGGDSGELYIFEVYINKTEVYISKSYGCGGHILDWTFNILDGDIKSISNFINLMDLVYEDTIIL